MGFLILAIVVVFIGEGFWIKLKIDGKKQLEKYDKNYSNVHADSAEELVFKIKNLQNADVSDVGYHDNKVSLKCQRNRYILNLEGGVVFIEYDRAGCKLMLSRIGKILNLFRFSKSVKKAAIINSVMDHLADKEIADGSKEYRKVKTERMGLLMSIIIIIISTIMGAFSLIGSKYDEAIENVKSTKYNSEITYGQMIDRYMISSEWKAFNSDANQPIVEVNGTSVEDEKICIQFTGELGAGLDMVSDQDFNVGYFEVDGKAINSDLAMEFIYEYLNQN